MITVPILLQYGGGCVATYVVTRQLGPGLSADTGAADWHWKVPK